MNWLDEIASRVGPAPDTVAVPGWWLWLAVGGALAACLVPPVWAIVRLAITLVHELGHALVGVAVGRKFTGFVLRGDMSGHAVTWGRPTGPGRIASTWAGYPAPAILGAVISWLALRGWAAPVLTALLIGLVVALLFARSALTIVVTLAAIVATGALWWGGGHELQASVLVAVAIVLVVGAWRHLAAVAGSPDHASDPGVLARLTPLPRVAWILSFVLVCAWASWVVGDDLVAMLR